MAVPADRDEQMTRFYRCHAERLRRAIAFKTCGQKDATIEDACAFAWETLLGRRTSTSATTRRYKVALRRAWAPGRRRCREQPIGGLNGADEDMLEPISLDSDVADVVADRVDRATGA